MTRCASVAPHEGPHPTWTGFLQAATGGGEDFMGALQVLLGCCLTGHALEHVLAFLLGARGNGKSVLLNTVSRLMGHCRRGLWRSFDGRE